MSLLHVFMSVLRHQRIAGALHRLCAAGAAALVLALAVFAVSPQAHDWVHARDDVHEHHTEQREHSCAVVLFAGGVSLPLHHIPLCGAAVVSANSCPLTPEELFLASPRYLRQPERGPPAC